MRSGVDHPIPLSVPYLAGNEWKYVKECLDTNWVSYVGPFVDRFEAELARQTAAHSAVATVSGTAALHVALLLAGVLPNTDVVMPPLSFVAPANAVRYCGAWPALVDLARKDWQLDVERLEHFLTRACQRRRDGLYNLRTERRISAIMPVHLLGDLCDVDAIAALAQRFDLPVVEDAAECMGARYKGRPIGAPSPGIDPARRLVATSFNGNKIMTTGGGGAILTSDAALGTRARHLVTTAKSHALEFFHDELGFNYRMTNIAAALGLAQLEQLEEFVSRKRATATRYADGLRGLPGIRLHPQSVDGASIYWLYTVCVHGSGLDVVRLLNQTSIGARPLWTPIANLPMYSAQCQGYEWPFATELHARAVSLPSSVGLTIEEQRSVIAAMRDACATTEE